MKVAFALLLTSIALTSLSSCEHKAPVHHEKVNPVKTSSSSTYTPAELEALSSILNRHDPLDLYKNDTLEPYANMAKSLLLKLDSNLSPLQIQRVTFAEISDHNTSNTSDSLLQELAMDISTFLKTGTYINEKGLLHFNHSNFYLDESEINSNEYKEFIPDSNL